MIRTSIKSKKNEELFVSSFFYAYICQMEMDFTKYSVEELRELQNRIGSYLHDMNDGFIYICQIRSYGNRWKNVLTNELAVNDLCIEYDGYDGIVDVYTTNPDAKISNYGEVNYIKSEEEYRKWKDATSLVSDIKDYEDGLKKWNDRENIPFHSRPTFAPMYTQEDVDVLKSKLETIGEYEKPTSIKKSEGYEESDYEGD